MATILIKKLTDEDDADRAARLAKQAAAEPELTPEIAKARLEKLIDDDVKALGMSRGHATALALTHRPEARELYALAYGKAAFDHNAKAELEATYAELDEQLVALAAKHAETRKAFGETLTEEQARTAVARTAKGQAIAKALGEVYAKLRSPSAGKVEKKSDAVVAIEHELAEVMKADPGLESERGQKLYTKLSHAKAGTAALAQKMATPVVAPIAKSGPEMELDSLVIIHMEKHGCGRPEAMTRVLETKEGAAAYERIRLSKFMPKGSIQ